MRLLPIFLGQKALREGKALNLKKFGFLAIFFTSCAAGNHVMTMGSFYDIPMGTSEAELKSVAGKPYRVHKNKNGEVVYEYIERIKVGGRTTSDTHYYLIFKNGIVVEKNIKQESTPPFYIDSYDLQTSSLEESGLEDNSLKKE